MSGIKKVREKYRSDTPKRTFSILFEKVPEKYHSDTRKRTFSILFHDVRLDIEEQNKKSEPFLFW